MAVVILLLCCAIGVGAWADEASPPETDQIPADLQEIEADTAARTETAEAPEPEAPDGESPDTFIPSEDISESISVKFPVDI